MTCQELADFIMDYVDGNLPDVQHRTFEEHLAVCPSCIEYLKSYKTTKMVLDDLGCDAQEQVHGQNPEGDFSALWHQVCRD